MGRYKRIQDAVDYLCSGESIAGPDRDRGYMFVAFDPNNRWYGVPAHVDDQFMEQLETEFEIRVVSWE